MAIPDPPIEMEFRDGVVVVPVHVAHLITISGIDTIEFTHEEALRISNEALLKNTLNDAMWKTIGSHFVENR